MPEQLQQLFEKIYQGISLTRDEMSQIFSAIISGQIDEVSLAGMLTALKVKGETVAEICGAADASLAVAKPFPYRSTDFGNSGIVDLVGTGGDGFNTINISTTSTFVAAAAGCKVAKHGSRSVSSKSGASDVLSHLGVDLTMAPALASQSLAENGICFLFAPHYHSGFKHAVPVRQALKTRTIFNILGPLVNPARPSFMLLGVYSPKLVQPIASVLKEMGVKRALVVHGSGMDEIAVHGDTQITELKEGELRHYTLSPADFGISTHSADDLVGGTPADNAEATRNILSGQGKPAHIDAVAVNAGAAIYLSGLADSLKVATSIAKEIMNSGKGLEKFKQLAAIGEVK
ncbi:anthranilate phosphoribosyltransferase [Shewanella sp. 202IG2-18]|nr:anthranilate phosphoribosyltransferase [Parashewanella hymeniacidonis]MBM7070549.1 anthranilate phosphoribosyltransferase [Parashewanella hymeniacidonis]